MTEPVLVDISNGVATVTLNRPDRLNALNAELLTALKSAALSLCWDDDIRAIVLTGAGRAFCAGGDLKSLSDSERQDVAFHDLAGLFHAVVTEFRRAPKVVLGVINGPAAGGGFSLALACDVRLMSEDAFYQVAYVANGLSIDGGGSWTLPRIVGYTKAAELIFTDERVKAEEALKLGLANWITPKENLAAKAEELAQKFADLPRKGVGQTKRLLQQSFDTPLETQLELERRGLAAAAVSPEGKEGLDAFLNKRRPNYRDL